MSDAVLDFQPDAQEFDFQADAAPAPPSVDPSKVPPQVQQVVQSQKPLSRINPKLAIAQPAIGAFTESNPAVRDVEDIGSAAKTAAQAAPPGPLPYPSAVRVGSVPVPPDPKVPMRQASAARGVEAATDLALPALIATGSGAPVEALEGLALGYGTSRAAKFGARKLGGGPEAQRLAEDVGWLATPAPLVKPHLGIDIGPEGGRAAAEILGGRAGAGVAVTPEGVTLRGKVGPLEASKTFTRGAKPVEKPALTPQTIEGELAKNPATRDEIADAQAATNYAGPEQAKAAVVAQRQAAAAAVEGAATEKPPAVAAPPENPKGVSNATAIKESAKNTGTRKEKAPETLGRIEPIGAGSRGPESHSSPKALSDTASSMAHGSTGGDGVSRNAAVDFQPDEVEVEKTGAIQKSGTEKPRASGSLDAGPVSSNGHMWSYKGGLFRKDGKVLDKSDDIADAVAALDQEDYFGGKTINGEIAQSKAEESHPDFQPDEAEIQKPSLEELNKRAVEAGIFKSGPGPEPGEVGTVKVSDLKMAPNKFQYKLGTDAEGVSTLLKDQDKYNHDLAGVVSVWRDPVDGKMYVVNGHHRYELAKRTRQKEISVRHIQAKDAVEARAIGALQNIAEGRGTPVDAAKFFRDTGTTPEKLKAKGISLGESTAQQGIALSRLDTRIFNRVVSGDLRPGRAVAIGEATDDPAEQKAILSLVERKERTGAKVSDDTLAELIRLVKGSEQTTETTADLFGTQEINRSLALEKAEISAHIKQQLARDKKLFGFVAKEGRATELARAGNKIDVERSKDISVGAAQSEEVYDKLSERGGPIGAILDESARRLAKGENAGTVKADAYQRVRAEVSKTLGRPDGQSSGRSEESPESSSQPQKTQPVTSQPQGSVELTLPGMESVPRERAAANAEQQGKELTAKLTEPPKSIESKAGEMEQKSPLFRDTEANPQKSIFDELIHGESGAYVPGKVRDYLDETLKDLRGARKLESGIFDLDSRHQARVLRAAQAIEKANEEYGGKAALPDYEQIYHYLENPDGEKLTPKQQDIFDRVVQPVMEQNQQLYEQLKDQGVPIDNYVHRVAKGKGGWFDRIVAGVKGTGKGNLLSKSAPQTKGRTMMALELEKPSRQDSFFRKPGERVVVSLKGGQVTAWKNGSPENLGGISHTDEGKVFEDKDGNIWRLKQATTKEIERDTELRYYHNALASAFVSNLQLAKAVDAAEFVNSFKSSPEFSAVAFKEGNGNPPKDWRRTQLPQFNGYYFEPHYADVLDRYAQRLQQTPSALDQVGVFMRTAMLLNPIMHPLNVSASWAIDRGVTGMLPHHWFAAARSGMRAIKAVATQNEDFLQALDEGAPLQSQREKTRQITQLFFDQLGEGLRNEEPWATRVAKSVGLAPVNLIKALHDLSSRVAWLSNDVLFLQAAYERQVGGMGMKAALRDTARVIPDYRLPAHVLNSRTLSKLMENRWATIFGSYHYGLLKGFAETAKSALGLNENPVGGDQVKDIAKGWDRLALMGLVAMALYPLLDELAKKLTGNQHAHAKRVGPFAVIEAWSDALQKRKTVGEALQTSITPAPQTKAVVELATNRESYSGRHIYDPHDDWAMQAQQVKRFLLGELGQIGQAQRASQSIAQRTKYLWGQVGVQFRPSRAEKIASDIASSKVGTAAAEPDEMEKYEGRHDMLDALRAGNMRPLEEAFKSGKVTRDQAFKLMQRAKRTTLQDTVYGFSYSEIMRVYDAATPEEKQQLLPLVRKKRDNLLLKGRVQEVASAQ